MLGGLGMKAVAAVSLSGGSYLSGTLPSCLGLGRHWGHSLPLSLILCLGGGVLFATSVVHVLAEARNALPDWADTIFCLGFMMLYLIDEFIKLFENHNEKAHCKLEVEGLLDRTIHHCYDSICDHDHDHKHHHEQEQGETEHGSPDESQEVSIKIKSAKSNRIGLLLAFSVHSIIEGLVIGIQPVPAKVLLLVGAVSSHKLVVAFCLGAELVSDGRSFLSLSQSMLVYSLGSSVGIVLGMLIDQWRSNATNTSIPILQAVAAGSLLYVTVSEVLPRERSRWEHQADHPSAGLLQFLAFALGFFLIVALVVFAK